ncbi:FAD-dependent oxidoreductase [Roseospirillum parvum]|uniref:NADPH-dependent glutamate synthase beta chain n=1 Tax=Roseospirillum parvum TaxID=83401 RepID=A0A1G7XJD0_9PROT|nr:FAD-dependent oxidoreductase [Roseospirillum parvum]SDG84216.1 NADPH-dependent glutamate synthase beta chain [Roseospirillum parvum]
MPVLTRGAYAEPGTSLAFKTGDWRTMRPVHKHWAAPCHGACPAGEDAQEWLARFQEGHPREAWETIAHINPLPAVTGRICPHPCETACNRTHYDSPIAIHALERWLGDQAILNNWSFPGAQGVAEPAAVAVVGAGPGGLSCAYQLARRGHKVTLIDALPEPGGLLRSAIPMTRLPRDVLDAEIGRILDLGITFKPHTRLGDEADLARLRQEHRAVFLAPGIGLAKNWSVGGQVPTDHRPALELLKEFIAHGKVPTPASVIIHGGGNTAVDLARVMKRAGVAEVHLVTASGLPGPDTEPGDILNVVPRELHEAIEEGIIFHPHRTIQRLLMRGSKLMGIEMVSLRKLPGASGRKSRVAFEGTETILHADMVIPAIGENVDPTGFEALLGGAPYFRPADEWGRLPGHPDLFVGGDARGDRGTAAGAIGDGRKAAEAIDLFLAGQEPVHQRRPTLPYDHLNMAYYEPAPRREPPVLPVEQRTDSDEIEGPLPDAEARAEANRCLSCGSCLACDNCWTYCPDNAVIKTIEQAQDGSHYVFDYEYCKGCGMCATECPCGYIVMEEDH